MIKNSKAKIYDLEERTYEFAKRCRDFVKKLHKSIDNIEYGKQLIRSSGSQAANYIEANESLSKKDFIFARRTPSSLTRRMNARTNTYFRVSGMLCSLM